tara:strand:+ start:1554 stop:2189 length:636 start_codon:yes stop_codon:yes gene_type:complete
MGSAANSGISRTAQAGQQAVDQWKNYIPKNTGASMVNQGLGALTSWGLANPGNETIGAYISGANLDLGYTLARMGLDSQYQNNQLNNLAKYSGLMDNLQTGNTLKLMAGEGDIARTLMREQGALGNKQIGVTGDQDRRTLRVAGQEKRLQSQEEGSQTRMNYMGQGLQNRMQAKTEGEEDRKTQRDRYNEERKMRADARGAIRSSGARFFG